LNKKIYFNFCFNQKKAAYQSPKSYTLLTKSGKLANKGTFNIPFIDYKGERLCDEGSKVGVKVEFIGEKATISFNVNGEWKVAFNDVEGPLVPLVCLESDSILRLLTPDLW
jgi:hypothetical protein